MKIVNQKVCVGMAYHCNCRNCEQLIEVEAYEFRWTGKMFKLTWKCPDCHGMNAEYIPDLMAKKKVLHYKEISE